MNKIRERLVHFDKTYGGRRGYRGHEVARATRGHAQGRVGLKHIGPCTGHTGPHVGELGQI